MINLKKYKKCQSGGFVELGQWGGGLESDLPTFF